MLIEDKKVPVRIALIMGKMVGGGVESVILDVVKKIDKRNFEFDFLVDVDSTHVPQKMIEAQGCRVIYVPPYQKIFKYWKSLYHIFSVNKYTIVHANVSSLNVLSLIVAFICKIPIRISHTHNLIAPGAGKIKNLIKWCLSFFSTTFATCLVAPTEKTGKWIYRKHEFKIIKNGIDPDKFIYSDLNRTKLRKKLEFTDENFVFGSFGRMIKSKNIFFLIDVFKETFKKNSQVKLLLIGDGPLKKKVHEYIKKELLESKVTVLDNQNEIEAYYSVLDAYIFPSTSEAFGMSAVEAQANGLRTIVSKGVPDEAEISDKLFLKNTNYDFDKWKLSLQEVSKKKIERKNMKKLILNKKMDAASMATAFYNLYIDQLKELK